MNSSAFYDVQTEEVGGKRFISIKAKVPYFSKLGSVKGCGTVEGQLAKKFFK